MAWGKGDITIHKDDPQEEKYLRKVVGHTKATDDKPSLVKSQYLSEEVPRKIHEDLDGDLLEPAKGLVKGEEPAEEPLSDVDAWNKAHPVGTVAKFPGIPRAVIRKPAFMHNGEMMVFIRQSGMAVKASKLTFAE